MSLRDEADRIGERAKDFAAQLRRAIGSISNQHATYAAVFKPGGQLSSAAAKVLDDLAAFCCVDDTTYRRGDRDEMLINEGKRQVYLYLQRKMKLDGEKLAALRRELREHEA